jgi:hypothetical protein
LILFELIKLKRMENWQRALCIPAKTGWPSHLGWWPN